MVAPPYCASGGDANAALCAVEEVPVERAVARLLNELYINGFALMEGAIPIATIERVQAAFLPLLEHVKEREHEIGPPERGDIRIGCGRQQHPNRYTLQWPWEGGLACPEIAEHPTLLALLEAYWESDDFVVTCLHSNSPYPGSGYQHWHRDITLLSPHVAMERVPHFGVKFPLVDTSEENGSFEVLPSTQYLADPELEGNYDAIIESGAYPHRTRLNMQRGTLWVQDPRALHRGTPNRSPAPRPELVICYSRTWAAGLARRPISIGAREYQCLSERGRRLFQRATVLPEPAAAA